MSARMCECTGTPEVHCTGKYGDRKYGDITPISPLGKYGDRKYGDITPISPLVKPETLALSSFISRLGSSELILSHIVL